MDRFTWAVVGGVIALCIAAMVSVVARPSQSPPDLSTPEGVATSYISAIRDKRADDAWVLLDSPKAIDSFAPNLSSTSLTQDAFRLQVNNASRGGDRRLRIVDTKVTDGTARVDVEITSFSEGGLFGPSSYSTTVTFNLKRQNNTWRITSSPSLYQLA